MIELDAEFWVAVAFVGFVGVLIYVGAHEMLLKLIDQRRDRIKAELDEATRLKEEAQALLARYQRKQREAEREAAEILAGANAEAERRIAEITSAAMVNVRGIAVEAATAIVERLAGTVAVGREAIEGAVAEALKR